MSVPDVLLEVVVLIAENIELLEVLRTSRIVCFVAYGA